MADGASLRFIDSDGHILEPPSGMAEFAPAAYRDRIWHVEIDGNGEEWMVYDGTRSSANIASLSATGGLGEDVTDRARRGELKYTETRPSGWDAKLRLQDMDLDGIEISVLYPTVLLGVQSLLDVDFGLVQARAYNDWASAHVEEPEAKGRLYVSGAVPPMHDEAGVQLVADEIRRVATLPGMVSVFMRPNPAVDWRPLHDRVYDPIWDAAQETGLPIALHPFFAPDLPGACRGLRLDEMHAGGDAQITEDLVHHGNFFFSQALANPVDVMAAIAYLTGGGVCERYPGAKFIFLECNGGWITSWLERLDHHAEKFSWDVPWLDGKPSDYFKRQCWMSFDPDESMLAFTAESPLVGADRIVWASDYPHPDAKFPGVTDELLEALAPLDDAKKRSIAYESAMALYGIG
jgi:predicted TIM-barrel fold metal-dependent hydrolase